MVQATQLPAYIRLRYEDSGVLSQMDAALGRAADSAKARFNAAFQDINNQMTRALSVDRNSAGSLDLGVDELRAFAVEQQKRAEAAREVASATARVYREQGQSNRETREALAATAALARQESSAAKAALAHADAAEAVQRELNKQKSAVEGTVQAFNAGTTANRMLANSQRAVRQASVQIGQQLQDLGISLYSGQRASTVFAQQLPQLAFALTSLEGQANKTRSTVGRFASVLSGPLGSVALVGASIGLGVLVEKLFSSEDAADKASGAHAELADILNDTTASYEQVTSALEDYIAAQSRANQTTLNSINIEATAIATNLRSAAAIREKVKANIDLYSSEVLAGPTGPNGQGQLGASIVLSQLNGRLAEEDAKIDRLVQAAGAVNVKAATAIAEINSDPAKRAAAGFDELRRQAKATIPDLDALTTRLTEINKAEAAYEARNGGRKSRSGRKSSRSSRAEAKEARELQKISRDAARDIARVNERFGEQRRLVDESASAIAELDLIISELGKRRPEGFESLVEAAQAAKEVAENAPVAEYERLFEESDKRLEIERLIATGHDEQAEALEIIWQYQERIGDLTDEQKDDIRDMVAYERERTRELDRQRDLIDAQVNVLETARGGLIDILSGRKTDILGNLQQSLKDLQGARLFDDLFGDAFAQLETELSRNTPVGKANERYARQVDETTSQTRELESAFQSLTQTVGVAQQAIATGTSYDQAAASAAGIAANDNEIVVTGRVPVEIGRMSSEDIANKIAGGIVGPLLDGFGDLFGTSFMQGLEGVLTGVLSGYMRGGEVGGVLGGLQSLNDKFGGDIFGPEVGKAISEGLGKALGGAQTGTQIAAIGKALGIKTSTTGAQIGGAIGSFIPIPGGQIIGSIAGGLLGGLFKKKKYGGATINGVDVLGSFGNSGSRREAGVGLGGSVNEAIANIADQLGAGVGNTGRVSVGLYKDNYRVSTSGSSKLGGYKGSESQNEARYGLYNFGDDQEAAIRFAVRDLIQDGVIQGLKASESRLLQAGDDIEQALRDVLDFRGVFEQLKEYKDPVGAALDVLDKEFERLIDLFEKAGASTEEFADLEELYGIRREEAIRDASERLTGALRSLLDDLTIGDSGLSLRSRRANALEEYDGLAARVAAGDTTAYDDFADAARALLDIERELFGSTKAYFDRLNEITDLTRERVDAEGNVASIAANRESPFDANGRAIESQTDVLGNKLDAINDNLVAWLRYNAIAGAGGGGGSSTRSFTSQSVLNF